jgi:hypothetical protein
VLDGTQSSSRNAKTVTLAERVGDQRNLAQVREEPALGLVVGMADIVANEDCPCRSIRTCGTWDTYSCFLGHAIAVSRKVELAIQQAMIGKLRFYNQTDRARQAKPSFSGKNS